MNEEERQRIVKAGLAKMKIAQPIKRTPIDDLLDRSQAVVTDVKNHIQPILAAGGWKDKGALQNILEKELLERFAKFDRAELIALVTVMHVAALMSSIEASPYGGSKPDLLSGL